VVPADCTSLFLDHLIAFLASCDLIAQVRDHGWKRNATHRQQPLEKALELIG
jgi:hypothetical protein